MNKTKRSVGLAQDRREEGFGCIKASRLVHVHRFIRHGAPTYPTCNSRTLPRCLHRIRVRMLTASHHMCHDYVSLACVYFASSLALYARTTLSVSVLVAEAYVIISMEQAWENLSDSSKTKCDEPVRRRFWLIRIRDTQHIGLFQDNNFKKKTCESKEFHEEF